MREVKERESRKHDQKINQLLKQNNFIVNLIYYFKEGKQTIS